MIRFEPAIPAGFTRRRSVSSGRSGSWFLSPLRLRVARGWLVVADEGVVVVTEQSDGHGGWQATRVEREDTGAVLWEVPHA